MNSAESRDIYRAEVIQISESGAKAACLVNGGYGLLQKSKSDGYVQQGRITQWLGISANQCIDIRWTIARKPPRGNRVSIQYRNISLATSIRCDNYHGDGRRFHMDISSNVGRGKRPKKKSVTDLDFDAVNQSQFSKVRFALHSVLDYVELNYDPNAAIYFFFPALAWIYPRGLATFRELVGPVNFPGFSWSELVDLLAWKSLEWTSKGQEFQAEEWFEAISIAADDIRDDLTQSGEVTIEIHGAASIFPLPLFPPPGSQVSWTGDRGIKPFGITFEQR